jgi:hypothetical protein
MSAKTPAIMTEINPGTAPAPEGASGILADLKTTGDGAGMEDFSTLAARPTRKISIQTLVMGLVLVASAASLYTMRKQGMNAGIKFKATAITGDIDKFKPAPDGSEKKILGDLARASQPSQAEAEPLSKNPFLLDAPAGDGQIATPVRDTSAERLAQLKQKFESIRLNSVMEGRHPLARVNDKLVSVGDIVEEVFLVAGIHGRSVDLIADGRTYTLSMTDNSNGGGATRKINRPQPPAFPRTEPPK